MTVENIFQPRRLGRFLAVDLVSVARGMLITAGAILGLLLVINVLSVGSWERWSFHAVFFPLTLLVGGHVATSLAFSDLHRPAQGYLYLTLPGSTLEKFLAKLLLTSLGWTLAAILSYTVFALVAAGLTQLLFGVSHPLFDPLDAEVARAVRVYLITQSVTLFGAIRFRKLALLKTVLALTALAVGAMIVFGVLTRVVFGPYFREFVVSGENLERMLSVDPARGGAVFELVQRWGRVALWVLEWVTAPFFWVVTYLRLAETELR